MTTAGLKRRDDGKCAAMLKDGTRRCTARAMDGQAVCKAHGGSSPQAMRKAAERLAVERARELLNKATTAKGRALAGFFDDDGQDIDPRDAFRALLRRQYQLVRSLDRLVEADMADRACKGQDDGLAAMRALADPPGPNGPGRASVLLIMLREARRDLADFAAAATRAGVDVARVELEAAQAERDNATADRLLDALESVLSSAGLGERTAELVGLLAAKLSHVSS